MNEYIGLPYSELDCWGLVCRIYDEKYHIKIPKLPIEVDERGQWESVMPGHEQAGDLLVFRIAELKRHVGIVIGDDRMIHSDEVNGVVVENYKTMLWNARLQKIYRHR